MFANILFRNHLNEGEKIYFVAHTHPFLMYPTFFKILFIGILVPLGFNIIMPPFQIMWFTWIGIGVIAFSHEIMNWYLDAWLVTNQGILDIQWNNFFNKSSTRIEYHTIEGITYEIKGFWGTVMNFGNITIEKMGAGTVMTLENVASPKRVEQEVLHYQKQFIHFKNLKDQTALRDMLVTMAQESRRGK